MKKLTSALGLVALLALILSNQAKADIILDTGAPDQTGSPLALDSSQWLAAEFTTTQLSQIDSLKGFINAVDVNQVGNSFTLALYGNTTNNASNNIPDTASEVFSQQATFAADGWNGLQGLSVSLDPGTYWLAFEVRATDTLQGLMPVYAPSPVQTAYNDATANFGYVPTTGTAYNFGAQVTSVPVPPALWLFASGLFAMGGRRLGKSKAI